MLDTTMTKGLSIAGALLLSACAQIDMKPTGQILTLNRLPDTYTHIGTDYEPLIRDRPVMLIAFQTDRPVERANAGLGIFGPFLHLQNCSSGATLNAGSLVRDPTAPQNTYHAAYETPLRDAVLRWARIDRNPTLLAEASPDNACLRLYGANMASMTLSSPSQRITGTQLTDDLTFTSAEIASTCPLGPATSAACATYLGNAR